MVGGPISSKETGRISDKGVILAHIWYNLKQKHPRKRRRPLIMRSPIYHLDRRSCARVLRRRERMTATKKARANEILDYSEDKGALETLKWALATFHPKIALASSFGAEDVALIDMMCKIIPKPRVFTLDTGRLHQETYDVMDSIRNRYGIDVEVYFPDASTVEKMVRENGPNLFYRSVDLRRLCCRVRKVEPLERALSDLDAWITGLRREQAPSRAETKKVEVDNDHGGIIKVNPLVDWISDQVWAYIREHKVPYNELHDHGYPSIGCEPCTRAVKPGEDPRTGRWWWEQGTHKECGLHFKPKETVRQE